jgi:Ni/Co efflux regulator RcnB
MNKKALVFAVAAACITSGAAFAQSTGYNHDSNARSERYDRSDRNDYRSDNRYERSDNRNDNRRGNAYGHRDERYSSRERSDYRADYRNDRNDYRRDSNDYRRDSYYAQPQHRHYRGGYVSQQYRDHRYVVNDWRGSNLYQPQRGYHWVQAGNDYLLVAIATGLIAQVLLNQ